MTPSLATARQELALARRAVSTLQGMVDELKHGLACMNNCPRTCALTNPGVSHRPLADQELTAHRGEIMGTDSVLDREAGLRLPCVSYQRIAGEAETSSAPINRVAPDRSRPDPQIGPSSSIEERTPSASSPCRRVPRASADPSGSPSPEGSPTPGEPHE